MTLSMPAALALAAQCAPAVAPETLLSVAHAESRFDPLAIGVNGGRNPPAMRNPTAAAQTARRYIAAGYSVDLGIAQINNANLRWLGLSVEDAFDPCRNLAAAARTNTTQVPGQAAGVALQNTINIRPVLRKNQGEEVGIFVAKDFDFADVYDVRLKR